jgi:hypothetical protein
MKKAADRHAQKKAANKGHFALPAATTRALMAPHLCRQKKENP